MLPPSLRLPRLRPLLPPPATRCAVATALSAHHACSHRSLHLPRPQPLLASARCRDVKSPHTLCLLGDKPGDQRPCVYR